MNKKSILVMIFCCLAFIVALEVMVMHFQHVKSQPQLIQICHINDVVDKCPEILNWKRIRKSWEWVPNDFLQQIISYPLPKDALWKARFLLYRYQTAQDAYDHSIQFDVYEYTDVASATNEDLINWQEKALQSLQEVWKMQDTLLQAPIEEQDIIISITKDTDTEMIPTLYDFVVWEWVVRFQSKNATPLPAETAWNGRFKATQNPDNEPAFILSVLDQAAKKGGKNRLSITF